MIFVLEKIRPSPMVHIIWKILMAVNLIKLVTLDSIQIWSLSWLTCKLLKSTLVQIEQKCLRIGHRFILSLFNPGMACPVPRTAGWYSTPEWLWTVHICSPEIFTSFEWFEFEFVKTFKMRHTYVASLSLYEVSDISNSEIV